jgi:hypothetical protein
VSVAGDIDPRAGAHRHRCRPLPSFDFHEPGWRSVFPEERSRGCCRCLAGARRSLDSGCEPVRRCGGLVLGESPPRRSGEGLSASTSSQRHRMPRRPSVSHDIPGCLTGLHEGAGGRSA